jgi:cell division protein ZapA
MTTRGGVPGERQGTLDVSLLRGDYKFACKESERDELVDAVAFLERRMREIRETSKVAGSERIAVMAALNTVHDMQVERRLHAAALDDAVASARKPASSAGVDDAQLRRRIGAMHAAIDEVLALTEKSP